MTPVERTRDRGSVKSRMVRLAILDSVACVLFGLGAYGKFIANGKAFHPLLNDSTVTTALLVLGALGMAYCGMKLITMVTERKK